MYLRKEKEKGGITSMMFLDDVASSAAIDFSGYISALTGTITTAQVLTVLAAVVGVGMAFFLMWLGVRKATAGFTTAVSTGRIRI